MRPDHVAWDHVRAKACEPGGWDAAHIHRPETWNAMWQSSLPDAVDSKNKDHPPPIVPHADESQVALDVKRSFHTWDDSSVGDRAVRQEQLRWIICDTLRAYPYLHYYQGFHDVVSVVVLTMCEAPQQTTPAATAETSIRASKEPARSPIYHDTQIWPDQHVQKSIQRVVRQVAVYFLRDCMTKDLLPAMGQLKIVQHILRAADAPYAYALERVFSPNHVVVCLSWLLTLFAHDVSTLRTAQRILDFAWSFGPASILYVCASVLLSQKESLHPRLYAMDVAEVHQHLSDAPRSLAADDVLADTLQKAASLMQQYPLTCPAVHAHHVLSCESVLFTWRAERVNIPMIMQLPTTHIALDVMPSPRDEVDSHSVVRSHLRPTWHRIFRELAHLHPMRRVLLYPKALFVSSLSLLLGGSVVTLLLAIHVTDHGRIA